MPHCQEALGDDRGHVWEERLRVGPTMIAPDGASGGVYPRIRMADGAEVRLFQSSPGVFLSPSFDRYTTVEPLRTLQMANGVTAHFDQRGALTDMVDAFGNVVEVVIDGLYRLQRVTQFLGQDQTRVVTFQYLPNTGLPVAMTYLDRTWQYTWEVVAQATRLTQATSPAGQVWTFAYDMQPRSLPDRLEHTVTVTLPQGGQVQYLSWQPQWPITNELDVLSWPSGIPKLYQRRVSAAANLNTPDDTWTFAYSENGRHTMVTGTQTLPPDGQPYFAYFYHYPGGDTSWGSDGYNPLVAYPTTLLGGFSGTGVDVTWVTWQPDSGPGEVERHGENLDPVSDPYIYRATLVKRTRNGHEYTTSYTYGGTDLNHQHFGQPVTVTESGDFTRTTTFTYDSFTGVPYLADRVSSETVTAGTESYGSSYAHDSSTGFLTSTIVLGVTSWITSDARGNVASLIDHNSHETTFDHRWGVVSATHTPESANVQLSVDEYGQTTESTVRGYTSRFEYDAVGRPTWVRPPASTATHATYGENGQSVTVTRGASSVTTTTDGFGRTVLTENSQGIKTRVEYDVLGRPTYTSLPYTSTTAEAGMHVVYDALGRVHTKTHADGSHVDYAYDRVTAGQRVSITDENGHVTRQVWAASGTPTASRLVSVEEASGQSTAQTTTYAYNLLGSLKTVTSPGGVTREWTYYDGTNRLWTQTQPELGTVTYGYDTVGNLTSQEDAKNLSTNYTYDRDNRLIEVTSPDTQYSTTITYDTANNRRTVTNGYVATTFDYDPANRLTQRVDVASGRRFATTYTLDGSGNVTDVRYPSNNHVRSIYDGENRVTQVDDTERGLVFAYAITHHPSGGLWTYTTGDGTVHSLTYDDSRQRPAQLVAARVSGPTVVDFTNAYDFVGNVNGVTDVRTGMSATFGYDVLDRLTSATGGGWGSLGFEYDSLGNRTSATHNGATTTYGYTSQRLMSLAGAETQTFTYDNNGNLTHDAVGTYTHTPANMIQTALVANGTALYTYRYDGDQQRLVTLQPGGKTTYTPRGPGGVLSEFDEQGGQLIWTVDYYYLGSRLLAAVRPATTPPGTTAVLTVGKTGSGSGTITSSPAGLDCGGTCSLSVPINTVVSLVATPGSGSVFAGWSGDPDCEYGVVTLSAARSCTASFQPAVTGDPRMWIDIPGGGAQLQPLRIAGWAIDLAAATGSGVDTVHLWAYPNPGSGTPAIFLGVAWYGGDRPDIAAAFGQDRFRFSGYDLTTSVTLAPNTYQLVVFAHSTVTGTFNQAQTVNIEIRTPNPAQWIDIPGNYAQVGAAFTVAGWAIDLNAPSGVGVDRVDISAQLNGTGTPIYLGSSATVPARPDIGAYFGNQFTNSSWGITASGLSPGTYLITVSPHNTSIDGHTAPSTVWVTVGQ